MQNSSKRAIYFCGSIRAGRQDVDLYQRIIGQAHDIFSRILEVRICEFFNQIQCHICFDFLKGSKLRMNAFFEQ